MCICVRAHMFVCMRVLIVFFLCFVDVNCPVMYVCQVEINFFKKEMDFIFNLI